MIAQQWSRECPEGSVISELFTRGGMTPDYSGVTVLIGVAPRCVPLVRSRAMPVEGASIGNVTRGFITRSVLLQCDAGSAMVSISVRHGAAIEAVSGTCRGIVAAPCGGMCDPPAATTCGTVACPAEPDWTTETATTCGWSRTLTQSVAWDQATLPTWGSGMNLPVYTFPAVSGLQANPYLEIEMMQSGSGCDIGDVNAEPSGSVWLFCGNRDGPRGGLTSLDFARGGIALAQCPPGVALIATQGRYSGVLGMGTCMRSLKLRRLLLTPNPARCPAVL